MNLVIDIGNTSISFCKFKGNKLISNVKLLQDEFKKTKLTSLISFFSEEKISKTIISSVVPNCNSIIKNDLKSKCLKFFFFDEFRKKINLEINIKKKEDIGDDRLVNIIFAKEKFKKSIIIVDFGTATTLDVLNKNGIYYGGIITPGIDLSLYSLKNKTAMLPLVKFKKTKKIVGFNTKEAIQSGFFWGYYSMVDGLIEKIKKEQNENFKVILTGGYANYFKDAFSNVILIDEFFTSKALNFILGKYSC